MQYTAGAKVQTLAKKRDTSVKRAMGTMATAAKSTVEITEKIMVIAEVSPSDSPQKKINKSGGPSSSRISAIPNTYL